MADKLQLSAQMSEMSALQSLAEVYAEVASTRMKNTREQVLKSRDFLSEINEIFEEVRASYATEIKKLMKKFRRKKGERITLLAHNGKTVAVLLSANAGLYGEIVPKTFYAFEKEVRESDCEVTIAGKQGLSLFLSRFPNHPYTYFDIPDHGLQSSQLSELIMHIVQYSDIHVYYGKFFNAVKQDPVKEVISAQTDLEKVTEQKVPSYLFEPDLEKILMFFESEIFASQFEQLVRESMLAKYASRLVAMDQASENVKRGLAMLRIEELKLRHQTANKSQLNLMPSIMMLT